MLRVAWRQGRAALHGAAGRFGPALVRGSVRAVSQLAEAGKGATPIPAGVDVRADEEESLSYYEDYCACRRLRRRAGPSWERDARPATRAAARLRAARPPQCTSTPRSSTTSTWPP